MNKAQQKEFKTRQATVSALKAKAQPEILKPSLRSSLKSMSKKEKTAFAGLI